MDGFYMSILKNMAVAAAIGAGIAAFPALSKADVITANFNQNNSCGASLGCSGSGLIAVATITDISGGVSIDITLKDSAFAFFQAGNPPMLGFQAAASALSGTSAAMNNLGGEARTWGLFGSFNSGGPGSFNTGVGYTPKDNIPFTFDIVFTLTGPSTASFTANGSGYIMGLDLCKLGTDGCSGTGFVGGKLTSVPLPITGAGLPGLIAAAGGLVALARRRRRIATYG